MIIGRGDIASAIKDRDGFIFFCSGVSNRTKLTIKDKNKEMDDVLKSNKSKMFVYISSLSIYYSKSEYTKHKIKMEEVVKSKFKNYCILRIGNIIWGTNPNTLINFFIRKVENKERFKVENTNRYLLDKPELNHWIGLIPKSGKHEMNITGKMVNVKKLVKRIRDIW